MYGQQPKKRMILCILEILKKYTDEQHRLSQKEVMDLLEKEYEMQVDRKSVKANLEDLMEFDSIFRFTDRSAKIRRTDLRHGYGDADEFPEPVHLLCRQQSLLGI